MIPPLGGAIMDCFDLSRRAAATRLMPDWFDKARQTITRRPPRAEPVPFERACVCGDMVRGDRLPQARRVACPGCGREWFILPLDPYPRPRPRSTQSPLWKRLTANGSSAETVTLPVKNGRPASPSSPAAFSPAAPPRPRKPPVRQQLKTKLASVKGSVRERARRAARPLRLVGLGIVLLLLLTGGWLWHRSRVDAASATLVAAVPQAERAIESRDFATARRLYAAAAAAVDVLRAEDARAAGIHQRHRELTASTGLASQTPYDLAAQAERNADPQSWTTQFAAVYGGQWVILDVPLGEAAAPTPVSAPEPGDGDKPAAKPSGKIIPLDLPLAVGKFPVRFEIDAAFLRPLKSPGRAIFAAQYDSWRLHRESGGAAIWVVRFRPDTAFLWCSADLYGAVGFDPDVSEDPPRAVLERQAKALGVPVTVEDESRQGTKIAEEAPR